jgi:hypothetical protein
MAGLLFGIAILLALGAVGWRVLSRARARSAHERALAQTPGLSAENPLRIRDFDELDDAVELTRCPCGGLLDRIGEGSRQGMRVVRCACMICEEDVDLFFDLSQLRN